MKEYKNLTPVVEKYRELCAAQKSGEEAREMLEESGLDAELRQLAQQELRESEELEEKLTLELRTLLLPRDPDDDKSAILEIRAAPAG
jgi:peptide chain release factor 1